MLKKKYKQEEQYEVIGRRCEGWKLGGMVRKGFSLEGKFGIQNWKEWGSWPGGYGEEHSRQREH